MPVTEADIAAPVVEEPLVGVGAAAAPAVETEVEGAPRRSAGRKWSIAGAVLGAYLVLSVLTWSRVWISGHPTSTVTCNCGDTGEELWFLRWFAYAVAHGHNPFYSGAMFAPQGFNTLGSTSFVLPAALLTPVTWLFGPVASFNVAATLTPVACGGTAYLATRRWVAWRPAAFVAGLLFAFCPMVANNLAFGHLQLDMLAFVPLIVLLLEDIVVSQRRGWRRSGVLLGLVVVGQFFTGTEVLAICVLLGGIGVLGLAVAFPRTVRSHLAYAVKGMGTAAAVAIVLLAYPLWFSLWGPRHFTGIYWPFIPAAGATLHQVLFAPGAHAVASISIATGYYGPLGPSIPFLGPALALLLLGGLIAYRREKVLWFWLGIGLVATLFGLGVTLGPVKDPLHTRTPWLPWNQLSNLPFLRNVIPSRFSGLTLLPAAFMLGIILDRLRTTLLRNRRAAPGRGGTSSDPRVPRSRLWGGTVGVLVIALGIGVLVPIARAETFPYVEHTVAPPAWFSTVGPKLAPGTTLLTMPFGSSGYVQPAVWQADDNMAWRMVGGFAFVPSPTDPDEPDYSGPGPAGTMLSALSFGNHPLPTGTPLELTLLRQLLTSYHVDLVVVTSVEDMPAYTAGLFTAVIGRPPVFTGGVWVWSRADHLSATIPLGPDTLARCTAVTGEAAGSEPLAVPACVMAAHGARR